jgi:hypothetical protein
VGEAFLNAWHADRNNTHTAPVRTVADLLDAGCFEAICFVDDEQFREPA